MGERTFDHDRSPCHGVLRKVADSFLNIWVQHSQTLRLSSIEAVQDDTEWEPSKPLFKVRARDIHCHIL